jgi:hypothetical protein
MQQVLPPGVQYGEEADPGAEVFGICGDAAQCLRGGMKQDAVDDPLVLQRQGREGGGNGEHNMKVRHKCCRQHLFVYVLFPVMWRSVMLPRLAARAHDFEST